MEEDQICRDLPLQVSNFVDAFVDFAVGGLFLDRPQQPPLAPLPFKTTYPSPDRLVAIGDLHGDLQKTKQALKLAKLIDNNDRWIAGKTMAVQIGDIFDRGGEELRLRYFLEKLKQEALKSGGLLLVMNGNHEIMNIEGDFRFVTRSGLEEFKIWADWYSSGLLMKSLCKGLDKQPDPFRGIPRVFPGIRKEFHDGFRARIAALRPEGPVSCRFLTENPTVLVVGESVFVHGGLLPNHVYHGLERINEEVREWISGFKGRFGPGFVRGRDSVVWLRKYSAELAKNCDCKALEHVLAIIPGAKRMIMGHTIQESGINGVCKNRAIRIDVGLSKGCGDGVPEVLEIKGNQELRILTSNPLYKNSGFGSSARDERKGLALVIPEHGIKQVEVRA